MGDTNGHGGADLHYLPQACLSGSMAAMFMCSLSSAEIRACTWRKLLCDSSIPEFGGSFLTNPGQIFERSDALVIVKRFRQTQKTLPGLYEKWPMFGWQVDFRWPDMSVHWQATNGFWMAVTVKGPC